MAKYDLPASLYYVLNQTGVEKLGYIGHSQGCQIALAQFSQNPELQSRISVFIAMAPASFLGHVKSPVRIIAHYARTLENVLDLFGHGEFLPSSTLIRFLGDLVCRYSRIPSVCRNVIFLFTGFDKQNINMTRLPVYLAHTPAGTSVRNAVHYCQAMVSDRFQQFDYGKAINKEKYGQETPPEYDLSKFTVRTVLYHGGNDWLAVPEDIKKLANHIGKAVINRYLLPTYNHLDFVWGMDAADLVYPTVLKYVLEN
ncbi:Gastric triacylglycerol lipase [Fasciola gigantica]|uniref:Gastric triacylglycerol lipase n=1 Tax=Fasciola gigantica TaxID=46835 RepID=A0A504WWG8_FASGI|nr:Gastric triacylglycerol lipase [Fasciola gigantica]